MVERIVLSTRLWSSETHVEDVGTCIEYATCTCLVVEPQNYLAIVYWFRLVWALKPDTMVIEGIGCGMPAWRHLSSSRRVRQDKAAFVKSV